VHAIAIAILFVVGSWAGNVAETHFQKIDPGQVIIDEVMGMLITLFLNPVGWAGALLAFFLFRLFDVIKPYPSNRFEALPGGIGPTEDDVTRDAVARALSLPLALDESIVERLRDRFARRGMTMPDINRRQAMVPSGAVVLPNPNGTAPGLWIERGRTAIALLPGPPREMKPMPETLGAERPAPDA